MGPEEVPTLTQIHSDATSIEPRYPRRNQTEKPATGTSTMQEILFFFFGGCLTNVLQASIILSLQRVNVVGEWFYHPSLSFTSLDTLAVGDGNITRKQHSLTGMFCPA